MPQGKGRTAGRTVGTLQVKGNLGPITLECSSKCKQGLRVKLSTGGFDSCSSLPLASACQASPCKHAHQAEALLLLACLHRLRHTPVAFKLLIVMSLCNSVKLHSRRCAAKPSTLGMPCVVVACVCCERLLQHAHCTL